MGVVFLVVVPTEKYEKVLKSGTKQKLLISIFFSALPSSFAIFFPASSETYEQNDSLNPGSLHANVIAAAKSYNLPAVRKNDLNAVPPPAPPADENAILRLEVELRDKHQKPKKPGKFKAKQFGAMDLNVGNAEGGFDVSMEKVGRLNSTSLHLKTTPLPPSHRDRFSRIC